jgi:hypothetical protein
MEVEHIIKTKQYFELTAAELVEVSSYASNEAEFDDVKAFLVSTQQAVKNQKINDTPELDDKVLGYLNQSYTPVTPWYNSVLLFLFPRDKQFFKYPAFQLGLASLLIFGVLNMVNFSTFKEGKMAFEDVEKYQNKEKVEIDSVEELIVSEPEFKANGADVSKLELKIEKEFSDLDLEKSSGVNFESDGYFGAESEILEEMMEEIPIADEVMPPSIMNDEEVDNDIVEFIEEVQALVDEEQVMISTTGNRVPSTVESKLTNDQEKSRNKKAKTLMNSEYKLESVSVGNQVSIQSTPELFELFFEVE